MNWPNKDCMETFGPAALCSR